MSKNKETKEVKNVEVEAEIIVATEDKTTEQITDEIIEIEDKVDTMEADGYEPTPEDLESYEAYNKDNSYEPTDEDMQSNDEYEDEDEDEIIELSDDQEKLMKQIKTVKANLRASLSTHKKILQSKLAELEDRLKEL